MSLNSANSLEHLWKTPISSIYFAYQYYESACQHPNLSFAGNQVISTKQKVDHFLHRNESVFVPLFLFLDSDRILLPMEEIEMSYSEDELGDGDGDGDGKVEGPTDEEAIYSPERQVRSTV